MTTTTTKSRFDQTVLVVGGGPSGASAAKVMVDKGYTKVHLFEAYPHPKSLAKTSSKAYVIALTPRGQQGIKDATGIDVLEEVSSSTSKLGVVSNHLARHVTTRKGKTSSRARHNPGIPRVIVTRQALTERLLDAARESHVTIHYQHKLTDIDFDNKVATFESGESTTTNVSYDLLIACDGCHSKVRKLMVENQTTLKDFTARTEEDSMEYQVTVLPKNPFAESHPRNTVHSWNNSEMNAICLGFPTKSKTGDETAMLFAMVFPEGKLASFHQSGYKEPLTKLLPDLFDGAQGDAHLETFKDQMRANQISNGGLCVWSSCLGHAPSGVLLLGDSGHGMWPSLGQGANCALESVSVFVKCLDGLSSSSDEAWTEKLIVAFQEARYEDAVSAVDLTYGGIGARESRGRLNAPLTNKLQMVGMMLLHKMSFGVIPMPALVRVLMGSKDISYSTAKKFHFGYEKFICGGALAVVLMGTAMGTIRFGAGRRGSGDL